MRMNVQILDCSSFFEISIILPFEDIERGIERELSIRHWLPLCTENNKYQDVITKSLDLVVIRNWFVCVYYPGLSCRRKSKMSVIRFAEEFTRLIIRYTRISSNSNPSNADMPLTDEQIVNAIRNVFYGLSIKSFDDSNPLETTTNSIAVTTPEVSIARKIKRELNIDNISRSQDVQTVITDDSSVSDISLKVIKKEKENSFDTLQNEKKFTSRSNPAICLNVSRSDTFIRKENQKVNIENQDVFEDSTNAETDNLSNDAFVVTLNEIRKSVMDVMAKLDNLKQSFSQLKKLPKEVEKVTAKVSQLSLSTGRFSSHRSSLTIKTKVPTIRRSSTNFPGTPMFSRKLLAVNGNTTERRKSTGGIGTSAGTPEKSGESTKVDYSVSNLNLSACNKASPGSFVEPGEFQPKFTKNPKYAHIQSTIPKAIQKKKMLQ